MEKKKITQEISVDDYLRKYKGEVRSRLTTIRSLVKKLAPDAEECVSYGMPAYKLHGMLLYVAAFTHHIGLYALPSAVTLFKKELTGFVTSKGTIQFRHDAPLPLALIKKIVSFRVKEQRAKSKMARAAKK